MTRKEFVELNPERHGKNPTGKCFVCGDDVASGKVLCFSHIEIYNQNISDLDFIHWCISHKDFNGNGRRLLLGKITIDKWCGIV